jgi:DNA-binding ferritin-like protein
VKEPAQVADDPWNPDVVDTRVSDHTLPPVYDPPDLDVSVPKPRPRAVSPDFAVKLLKDFLKGKISIEDGEVVSVDSSLEVPSKRVAASFQRVISGRHFGKELYLVDLADLLNATQADIHFMHFYAGGGGNWDRIHDICSDYYLRLAEDYDDVAELCLQIGADIAHPNDSAVSVGFKNSTGSLGHTFDYESAMEILQDRLHNLVEVAVGVAGLYQASDNDSTAVRNYLEDFIEEWSKEADYKLKERLGGVDDFGGSYRARVPGDQFAGSVPERELITGDVDENEVF